MWYDDDDDDGDENNDGGNVGIDMSTQRKKKKDPYIHYMNQSKNYRY